MTPQDYDKLDRDEELKLPFAAVHKPKRKIQFESTGCCSCDEIQKQTGSRTAMCLGCTLAMEEHDRQVEEAQQIELDHKI